MINMRSLKGKVIGLVLAGCLVLQPVVPFEYMGGFGSEGGFGSFGEARVLASSDLAGVASVAMNHASSDLAGAASAAMNPAKVASVRIAADVEAQAPEPQLRLVEESPVTAGVQHVKYEWHAERASRPYMSIANVLVVDLHQPYVELGVMSGRNHRIDTKQTVVNMAREYGAVAAVNGDFFHMNLSQPPIGPVVSNNELLVSPMNTEGWYTFGIAKDSETGHKKPVIDHYIFEGTVIAENGATYKLSSINRAGQWRNNVHSHWDAIHLYTSDWGKIDRADDPNYIPMEVLVVDDVVAEITSIGSTLAMVPPENGYILRVNRDAAAFVNSNLAVGDTIEIEYNLKPLDPNNPIDGTQLEMLIGGQTLLVENGEASAFTTNVDRTATARTGVGFSQNERYVYLITIDHNGPSQGMTLAEFQQFMLKLGVYKGMNLDGGGSTTLISRQLGETDVRVANRPSTGYQRQVANGIGVYTTAPVGQLAGYILTGRSELFLREAASYELRAYDTYFNPYAFNASEARWTADKGSFVNDVFTPTEVGSTFIEAVIGGIKERMEVTVLGREHLSRLAIDSPPLIVREAGETHRLPVIATTKNNVTRTVPASAVEWEAIGFEASFDGDVLTVHELPELGYGQLVASYNGFSTILDVSVGRSELWADFDELTYEITHHKYPAESTGRAWIVDGLPFRADQKDRALYITYNFMEGSGNRASYAQFDVPDGVLIEGEPVEMTMDVLGDNSGNWIRMEAWDAHGVLQRIDINTNVNWYGWETVSVDLQPYDLAYPIKLKHIYVASPAAGQENRQPIGQMAFDNLRWEYRVERPQLEPKHIELTVDSPFLTMEGQQLELDQVPILENGTTLVPIKFVVDAMGGTIEWDGAEQKVTIEGGGNLIEMWIGNADINLNGQVSTSLLPPRIVNSRTMVPLRLIAEQMGWDVTWVGETQTIILQ